jgi:hypothetical protein
MADRRSLTDRLSHQAFKLCEDGAFLVGVVIDLPALYFTGDDAGVGQVFQFTLHRATTAFDSIEHLFSVKRGIHVRIEEGKHQLSCFVEETVAQRIIDHFVTRFGYYFTQYG